MNDKLPSEIVLTVSLTTSESKASSISRLLIEEEEEGDCDIVEAWDKSIRDATRAIIWLISGNAGESFKNSR